MKLFGLVHIQTVGCIRHSRHTLKTYSHTHTKKWHEWTNIRTGCGGGSHVLTVHSTFERNKIIKRKHEKYTAQLRRCIEMLDDHWSLVLFHGSLTRFPVLTTKSQFSSHQHYSNFNIGSTRFN